MPAISLFQPTVLRGVVEKFTTPESLTLLAAADKTPWPFPSATWDVIRGSRAIARPNVPNAEAHVVPRLGRSQQSASFLYLREKKTFDPVTLHWIRQPGTIAQTNAEASVLREIGDLNIRFDNFAEYCLWQMFTGNLVLDYPDVQANIDYQFPATHKPTVSSRWDQATPATIINDVTAWKRLGLRDGRVALDTAYLTSLTMSYIFRSFATAGSSASNFYGAALLSDRMKDQYYTTGTLPGFMGINWLLQENVYDATGAAYTTAPTDPGQEQLFLNDDALILGNFTENRPYELMEGPSADDEAGDGFTGKFSKTWKEPDPSARQYLLEWSFLPVVTRPEQFVYVSDVAPGNGVGQS